MGLSRSSSASPPAQRWSSCSYIITRQSDQGSTSGVDFVRAPSNDRVQVTYQVAIYFKLNTDRLRSFHEQLGLKYKAFTSKGWDKLIQDTFRQQIENALQQETRRYPVNEIYGRILGDARPARSTVQVSALPRGALVEVDFVAATRT